MGRGRAKFRQAELSRIIRAARKEGADRVEVETDGRIVVVLSKSEADGAPGNGAAHDDERNEWDEKYGDH
jgi:hypothetical protein